MTTHPHADSTYKYLGNNVSVSKQLRVQESIRLGGTKTTPSAVDDTAHIWYDETTESIRSISGTSNYFAITRPVVILTAAKTVEASENGTIFVLNLAAGFAVTLPDVKAGLQYRFIVRDKTADYTVASANANIHGNISTAADGAAAATTNGTAIQTITFDQSGSMEVGDYIDLVSDGNFWYVSGMCNAATGIAFS